MEEGRFPSAWGGRVGLALPQITPCLLKDGVSLEGVAFKAEHVGLGRTAARAVGSTALGGAMPPALSQRKSRPWPAVDQAACVQACYPSRRARAAAWAAKEEACAARSRVIMGSTGDFGLQDLARTLAARWRQRAAHVAVGDRHDDAFCLDVRTTRRLNVWGRLPPRGQGDLGTILAGAAFGQQTAAHRKKGDGICHHCHLESEDLPHRWWRCPAFETARRQAASDQYLALPAALARLRLRARVAASSASDASRSAGGGATALH